MAKNFKIKTASIKARNFSAAQDAKCGNLYIREILKTKRLNIGPENKNFDYRLIDHGKHFIE